MPKLIRRRERPQPDGDPLVALTRSVAGLAVGFLAGLATYAALKHLPVLRGHDPYEARLLAPAGVAGLVAGLVGTWRGSPSQPWPLAVPVAIATLIHAWVLMATGGSDEANPAVSALLLPVTMALGALGCVSGWMDRRRRAMRPTWLRTNALLAGCALGLLALAPYALLPHVVPRFDLAVHLGERQLPTRYSAPWGILWVVSAVLTAAATRLPHPIVVLGGLAGVGSGAASLAHSPMEPDWLSVILAGLRAAAWVLVAGLILQAVHELHDADERGRLKRRKRPKDATRITTGRSAPVRRSEEPPSGDQDYRGPYLR